MISFFNPKCVFMWVHWHSVLTTKLVYSNRTVNSHLSLLSGMKASFNMNKGHIWRDESIKTDTRSSIRWDPQVFARVFRSYVSDGYEGALRFFMPDEWHDPLLAFLLRRTQQFSNHLCTQSFLTVLSKHSETQRWHTAYFHPSLWPFCRKCNTDA